MDFSYLWGIIRPYHKNTPQSKQSFLPQRNEGTAAPSAVPTLAFHGSNSIDIIFLSILSLFAKRPHSAECGLLVSPRWQVSRFFYTNHAEFSQKSSILFLYHLKPLNKKYVFPQKSGAKVFHICPAPYALHGSNSVDIYLFFFSFLQKTAPSRMRFFVYVPSGQALLQQGFHLLTLLMDDEIGHLAHMPDFGVLGDFQLVWQIALKHTDHRCLPLF